MGEELEEMSKKQKIEMEDAKGKQRQIIEKNVAHLKSLQEKTGQREKNLLSQKVACEDDAKRLNGSLEEAKNKIVTLVKENEELHQDLKNHKDLVLQYNEVEDKKKRQIALENTNAEQLKRLRRADADHASAKD